MFSGPNLDGAEWAVTQGLPQFSNKITINYYLTTHDVCL